MNVLNSLARRAGAPFIETPHQLVSLDDSESIEKAISWWGELSSSGAEGVVIKPLCFVPRGRRGFAQPALKCRGKEHLRLVYGPEYDLPENLVRMIDREALADRRRKHRRILRQAALSVEAVERFVRQEELSRVRECVRAVLSLEGC
jgi:protein phosphatase